jgi:hypothetical protein
VGIVGRVVLLGLLCLLVFTPPGQRVWRAGVDWASDKATERGEDKVEESLERQRLRERLRSVEPMCGSDVRPKGFEVSEGQAIALVARKREIDCDLVDSEPLGGRLGDARWSVHFDANKAGGCEFSGDVDGTTGEVSNRYNSCKR